MNQKKLTTVLVQPRLTDLEPYFLKTAKCIREKFEQYVLDHVNGETLTDWFIIA